MVIDRCRRRPHSPQRFEPYPPDVRGGEMRNHGATPSRNSLSRKMDSEVSVRTPRRSGLACQAIEFSAVALQSLSVPFSM